MKRFFIVLLLVPGFIFAQHTKKINGGWKTITSTGLAIGEANTKPVFQLSGGFTYRRYFTGIGIGYDTYEFNSIPVFADWRMSFGRRQIGFIYADGGYNFPGSYKRNNEFSKTSDRLRGGLYMDAGIGYRIPLGTLHRLSVSAGFSRKNIIQRKVFVYPCLTAPCPEDIHDYDYNFNRILTRLSWEFGK